jgi:hypothetical protein
VFAAAVGVPVAPVEAISPDAALTEATEALCVALLVALLSSTLLPPAPAVPSFEVGQTLKETMPTRVTKTIAAPASTAPDAPIPTMKLSGVLFADVLVAA